MTDLLVYIFAFVKAIRPHGILTVMSYGDTRHCTHDDDSADIENLTFKSAHETLSM